MLFDPDEKPPRGLDTFFTRSGDAPGSGLYRIVSSRIYGGSTMIPSDQRPLLNLFVDDASFGHWGGGTGSDGKFNGDASKLSSLDGIYEGHFVCVTLPQCFKMEMSGFVEPASYLHNRLPGRYNIYARNTDNDVWKVIFEQLEIDAYEPAQLIDTGVAGCYFQNGLVVS